MAETETWRSWGTRYLCSVRSSREAFPASRMSSATGLRSSGHSHVPLSSVRSWKAARQKSGLLVVILPLPGARSSLSQADLRLLVRQSQDILTTAGIHDTGVAH